jgi:amino acid transporter
MKKFNLNEHNKKYMDIAKQAAKGTYPSKKVAFVGSIVGGIIGGILFLVGIVGTLTGYTWGVGSLIAGGATGLSNIYNLKRLQSR